MYGRIFNVTGLANGGGTIDLTHYLGTDNFCSFITQDITGGDTKRVKPRIWTSAKGATTATVRNDTVAGAVGCSVLTCTAHSILDVGPVVNGALRFNNATDIRRMHSPSYRSLHRSVKFACVQGQQNVSVDVVHQLNTQSVLAFYSPVSDPVDSGDVTDILRVFTNSVLGNNSIRLTCVPTKGAVFQNNTDLYMDVMVLARPTVGHSMPYLGGGDYAAGQPALARLPDYAVGYYNVDGVSSVIAGLDLIHNLNGYARHLLAGYTDNPGLSGAVIVDRTSTGNETKRTLVTVDEAGSVLNNLHVLVLRDYSPFIRA